MRQVWTGIGVVGNGKTCRLAQGMHGSPRRRVRLAREEGYAVVQVSQAHSEAELGR